MPEKLQLYLAMGKRRGEDPLHWMLMLKDPEKDQSTWYHVTGGSGTYKVTIQGGKRFRSQGIGSHHFICEFAESDRNRLKSACQRTRLARCQEWTTAVLGELEAKDLVPEGTRDKWFNRIEPSQWSTDGVHGIHTKATTASSSSSSSGNSRRQVSGSSQSRTSRASQPQTHSSVSQSSDGWVWDAKYSRYRCWHATTNRWVWQK